MFIKKRVQFNKDDGGAGGFVSMSDVEAGEEVIIEDDKPVEGDKPKEEDKPKETEEDKPVEEKPKEVVKAPEEKPKEEIKKPEDKAPVIEDELDEDELFWAEVDKLKGGDPLEVDFGDVDPLSPEGIVIRDKAVQDDAIAKFEAYLSATYPKSYALLAHESAGGKVEDFFEKMGESTDLPTVAELENDVALQERIVTQHLKSLGNSDKVIANIIKAAKVDDELEETAKEALIAEKKREDATLKQIQAEAETKQTEKTTAINNMIAFVGQELEVGEIDGIIVPEKDRAPFGQAFLNSIRYDNGKFIMTTELTQENFKEVFKEKFYSYKKGDLGELVKKAAKTENAVRLRRTITKNEKPKGESGGGASFVSLNDVD